MRLGLVGRGPVGRFLAARLDPAFWTGRELLLDEGLDGVILAVPDGAIASAAEHVRARFQPAALIHCSGATPLDALGHTSARAVWHPMRPFPVGAHIEALDCVVGLRGDSTWVSRLEGWSRSWGGEPVVLGEDQALRVHLACCYAAGATALMTTLARGHFLEAGLNPQAMSQAIRGLSYPAIEAVLTQGGQGITGPARRADHGVMNAQKGLQMPPEQALSDAIFGQLKALGLVPSD